MTFWEFTGYWESRFSRVDFVRLVQNVPKDSATQLWYVKDYLRKAYGLDVVHDPTIGVQGQISFSRREIKLNITWPPTALIVLVHEAGHWLHFLKNGYEQRIPRPPTRIAEIGAYLYGWVLIRRLELPITKDAWSSHHAYLWDQKIWSSLYDENDVPRSWDRTL